MKNILITGVAGQDGSYLSEILLELGRKVIGIDLPKTYGNMNNLKDIFFHPNFTYIEGDIRKTINDITSSFSKLC